MKKIYTILLTSAVLFAGCEEFQPVFTGEYENPDSYTQYTDADFGELTTIADLKDMYVNNGNKPITISHDCVIKGQVTTSDQVGNLYKSLYIQDETAGIEIKIGKNGLYNEYKLGQWVYVQCEGLTVGDYNGMIQVGYSDPTGEYETAYLELSWLIDTHVFKGAYDDPVEPVVITEADLRKKENLGRLVTIKGLEYGNEIFCLIYVNPNLSGAAKKAATNRIFISTDYDETPHNWGVTTWAMSETLFEKYLNAGNFDAAALQDDSKTVAQFRKKDGSYAIIPAAYSVSQYFYMGKSAVQVRSSGYARFSDEEIDADVLAGKATVDFTGILTEYDGESQFTLIDLNGVKVNK